MVDTNVHIEAVRRAKARYCRFVDTKEWGLFAELFEPSFKFRMLTPTGEVAVSFEDRDSYLEACRTFLEGARTIHQVHNDEIDQISDTEIVAIWSMEDLVIIPNPTGGRPTRMHGRGHYHERWTLGAEGWRIASVELRRTILETVNT